MSAATPALDVLVVEDDPSLRHVLAVHLGAEGWAVRTAAEGAEALARCGERPPDVVVLDVMLPGPSGLQVCAALRERFDPSPGVVMVTARADEADVMVGFEAGADDYVVKPFRPREVVARVRALARRVRRGGAAVVAPVEESPGELHIDAGAREVRVRGAPVRLTATEFELLALLASDPARVFTRMELLERIWDTTHAGYARNVDCHVTRVRRKLEAVGMLPAPIATVHGVGYRFDLARAR